MALRNNVSSVGMKRSGCSSIICSSTFKPTNGLSMGKLLTRTGVLMERNNDNSLGGSVQHTVGNRKVCLF